MTPRPLSATPTASSSARGTARCPHDSPCLRDVLPHLQAEIYLVDRARRMTCEAQGTLRMPCFTRQPGRNQVDANRVVS